MTKLITEEQKHEIEKLAEDHSDALIAYGADLYRKGIYKGAIIVSIGVLIGAVVTSAVSAVKEVRNKKQNNSES